MGCWKLQNGGNNYETNTKQPTTTTRCQWAHYQTNCFRRIPFLPLFLSFSNQPYSHPPSPTAKKKIFKQPECLLKKCDKVTSTEEWLVIQKPLGSGDGNNRTCKYNPKLAKTAWSRRELTVKDTTQKRWINFVLTLFKKWNLLIIHKEKTKEIKLYVQFFRSK